MSAADKLAQQLTELRADRDALAATRTREDVRALAETWLAAACTRMNGTAGLVLNGHANGPEIQAVLAEFLLNSPGLLDFLVQRVEATTELSSRARDSRLRKLDAAIADVERRHLAARKQEAMEALEAQFAGDAA